MEALAPFHPALVHAPIALIIVSAAFELIGRALDREWWRKAAFAMLIVGVLGAAAAVLSGLPAGEHAEHQRVPEQAVDEHEEMALMSLWIGIAAVALRAVASRTGPLKPAAGALALLLHLAVAVTIGITGLRGGRLVFDEGAGVRATGRTLTPAAGEAREAGEKVKGGADEDRGRR